MLDGCVVTWNCKEFNDLCKKHDLLSSTEYQESLHFKIKRANYHGELSQSYFPLNLIQEFMSGDGLVSDSDIRPELFKCEANAEACAQALHSMFDIMGQILNRSLLSRRLKVEGVTLPKVNTKLKDALDCDNITGKIDDFLNSEEANYLTAFVNTIKHRQLINTKWYEEFNFEKDSYVNELRFKKFEYKKKTYQELRVETLVVSYRKEVIKGIVEIGREINNYLKSKH